jgi:hypothetical protein
MKKNDDGILEIVGEDVKVTLNDLRSFVSLIGRHNIATKQAFKSFLSEFDMDKIFMYDETQPPEVNMRHFFALFANCTCLQMVYFDGKHQGIISGYFATGYYEPWPIISFNSSPYSTFEECKVFAGIPKTEVDKAKFQCFTKQTVCVGIPEGDLPVVEQMSVLKDFGLGRTNSKDCSVTDNVKTLWQEFTKWLDEEEKIDKLKPLNYDHMWNGKNAMTELDANLKSIYRFIVDWIESKQKEDLVNGGCDWANATKTA